MTYAWLNEQIYLGKLITAGDLDWQNGNLKTAQGGTTLHLWNHLPNETQRALACLNRSAFRFFKILHHQKPILPLESTLEEEMDEEERYYLL
jgi:hypothetical protein